MSGPGRVCLASIDSEDYRQHATQTRPSQIISKRPAKAKSILFAPNLEDGFMSPSFMDVWTVCLRHRRMSSSRHIAGVTLSNVTGLNWDIWLFGHHEILAWQWAKLLRYGREGAVEVRPFPAEKRLLVSEVQGLSGEAMKGNPTTTVIPRVDESKSSPRTTVD